MKYFQSLLNPIGAPGVNLEDEDMPRLTNRPVLDPIMLNEEISIEEIKDAIHANRDNKSPGTDGIKPAFIKNDAFVRFVRALCNHCFKTGTVDSWLKAIIKPIPPKSKESTIPSEYRGIALQSFVAKSYCRVLNNRLRECLEINNALSDEQNGFRPNRCCQDHILTLVSIVENRMLQKKDTFACFIDFRKAFDCVDRELLWRKLAASYNIGGNFLSALRALYSEVKCAVDVNRNLRVVRRK